MSELNRDDIIQGLRENDSPYKEDQDIIMDAIALIKELTEEATWKGTEIVQLKHDMDKLTEENERLHASCTELTQCCTKLETLYKIESKRVDTVRADTVREMLQRIKDNALSISLLSNPPKFMLEIREDALDQIAKEMLEENK